MLPAVGLNKSPSANSKLPPVINQNGLKKIPLKQLNGYTFGYILSSLRDRKIDETLALNHLVRGEATSKGNNCLLHTIFQQITMFLPGISLSEFIVEIRGRIHRTKGEMLSVNDEEEGVRIFKEVQCYLLDITKARYFFDLTVLFADNDGEIAQVQMDQVAQHLSQDGSSIPLRIIAVNYNHYEPLFLHDQVVHLGNQLDNLGIEPSAERSLPAYVVNIPMKVDSDDEGNSSGGEDDNQKFSNAMFQKPSDYFRLFPSDEWKGNRKITKRGTIVNNISLMDASINSPDRERLTSLLSLFEAEASRLNDAQQGRLGITIGFNKMRSLSRRRNRTIERCVNEPTNSILPINKIGFLWDGVWQKRTNAAGSWQDASYEDVRHFYRQLKKKDPKKAEMFRAKIERKRAHMVPYREIRDTIKNHDQTKQITQLFRSINPNRDTYLAFLDGDLISFHSQKEAPGPFSIFDKNYLATGFEIGSTGYTIRAPENPVLEVGVLADLVVRNSTARHIRGGVYYPEPCAVVKIPPHSDTVPENFADPRDRHYQSPKEMPKLIEQVLVTRGLSAQNSMIFDASGAIVTALPRRMKRTFACRSTDENGIILWGLPDFKTMRDINQTHYNSRDWALNLLPALPIRSRIAFEGRQLDDQKVIQDVLTSLLSRLFSAFDPVDRAQRASVSSNRSFQACFVEIVRNSQASSMEVLPTSNRDRTARTPRKNAKNKAAADAKSQLVNALWEKADGLTTLTGLRKMLSVLLSHDFNDAIIHAAEESGKSLSALFRQRLCLDYEALVTYSLAKLVRENQNIVRQLMPSLYSEIIGGSSLIQVGSVNRTKAAVKSLVIGAFYDVTPLHIAALAGNLEVVNWLLDQFRNRFSEGSKDCNGLIPLDYALEHCENNGINIELISSLCIQDVLEVVQEKIAESFDSESDRAWIMNGLFLKFGGDVIQKFDDKLFLEAVLQDYSGLAKELSGMSDYCDVIIDAIYEYAPQIDPRLMAWAEKDDIEEVRNMLDETELMLFETNLGYGEYVSDRDQEDLGFSGYDSGGTDPYEEGYASDYEESFSGDSDEE